MMRTVFTIATFVSTTNAFTSTVTRRMSSRGLSMIAKEGDSIPSVTFKCRVRDESLPGPNPFTWKDVTTENLFKGKRAVLFALPGF